MLELLDVAYSVSQIIDAPNNVLRLLLMADVRCYELSGILPQLFQFREDIIPEQVSDDPDDSGHGEVESGRYIWVHDVDNTPESRNSDADSRADYVPGFSDMLR